MTLRAEQWAMVGVVAIGATAAYLLTRARPRDLERMDAGRPQQPAPFPSTPVAPPLPTPPGGLQLQQNILRAGAPGQPSRALLRQGTNVLGRLELGGNDRAADDATALRNLQLAGFSDVRLYTLADIRANPSLVPLTAALTNPTTGSRWFWATWNGNGTIAAGDVMMPREVVLLWYTTTTPPSRLAFASR